MPGIVGRHGTADKPTSLAERRSWTDYSLGRALATEHLAALDIVYEGVNGDHRKAIARLGEIDPVSEDPLLGHFADPELFQWFVRAHLESSAGNLASADATSEKEAAEAARRAG